jgi:hypothetical protein
VEDYLVDIQKNKAYALIKADKDGFPLIKRYELHGKQPGFTCYYAFSPLM